MSSQGAKRFVVAGTVAGLVLGLAGPALAGPAVVAFGELLSSVRKRNQRSRNDPARRAAERLLRLRREGYRGSPRSALRRFRQWERLRHRFVSREPFRVRASLRRRSGWPSGARMVHRARLIRDARLKVAYHLRGWQRQSNRARDRRAQHFDGQQRARSDAFARARNRASVLVERTLGRWRDRRDFGFPGFATPAGAYAPRWLERTSTIPIFDARSL